MIIQSLKVIYSKLILCVFLWGGTFISGRVLAQNYDPFLISFLRFIIATIVLLLYLLIGSNQSLRLTPSKFFLVLILGVTGVFSYNYFFFSGLKIVEAGRASVIVTTNPAVITLFAAIFLGESLSIRKALGAFIALLGAVIVVSDGDLFKLFGGAFGLGDVFLIFAVCSWAAYTLFGKIVLRKMTPLITTTWACILGTILLLPFALQNGLVSSIPNIKGSEWLHLVYLGAFGTSISFLLFYEGVKAIGATRAAAFINMVPIMGISMGALFFDESIALSLLIGAVFVIFGIYLVNKTDVQVTKEKPRQPF
ncbi:MAG: drug/metabolite transporter (DMT)-like permease [Bacteriovoracaceae bacterium]|jgi:drug/metabolite transporter (DMT)-like permease